MTKPSIIIYCDGGLGNRLNALLSGLAISRHFDLNPTIHWPVNSNCGAAIEDLIETEVNHSRTSLTKLKNQVSNHAMLLHDSIAAKALGRDFSSAYDFKSLQEFESITIRKGSPLFYYPAVIPAWLPSDMIAAEVENLRFSSEIEKIALEFIKNHLGRPFYGLHLRRTDLNIGLSDIEVFRLVKSQPKQLFFVCSDDPQAEQLAASHSNVRARSKKSYVSKCDVESSWLNPKIDEDGRLMGNLDRGRDSVIDAAVDLLILGYSSIVGYSGSTFQSMARLIGDHYGLLQWQRPPALDHYSPSEVSREIRAKRLSVSHLIQIAGTWSEQLNEVSAAHTLTSALDSFDDDERKHLLYALAQLAIRDHQLVLASIYLREVIRLAPTLADPRSLLNTIEKKVQTHVV